MSSKLTTARSIIDEPGRGRVEVWPIKTDEDTLWLLLQEVFQGHWQTIRFGTMVPGAVWEIRAPNAPTRVSLLDGYATVDFGAWHFHICIGNYTGIDAALAAQRRTSRAEFYRIVNAQDEPKSWGLRLFSQAGDQQLTVFLPNPFIHDDGWITGAPNWEKLAAWDALRGDFLGMLPDPIDRSARKASCSS